MDRMSEHTEGVQKLDQQIIALQEYKHELNMQPYREGGISRMYQRFAVYLVKRHVDRLLNQLFLRRNIERAATSRD